MPYMPSFYQDPYVGKTKEELYGVGGEFLRGEPSEYFAPIGEWGGEELQNLINMISRDVSTSVYGDVIKRGVGRGPAATSLISRKVGDVSTQLRWQDLLRGLEGRKFLLGQGRGMVTDVGQMGLQEQQQRNVFEMGIADLTRRDEATKEAKKMQEAQFWQNILSSIGGIYGGAANIGMWSSMIDKLGTA